MKIADLIMWKQDLVRSQHLLTRHMVSSGGSIMTKDISGTR